MKKILTIILLLASFAGFSQFNLKVDTLKLQRGGTLYKLTNPSYYWLVNNDTIFEWWQLNTARTAFKNPIGKKWLYKGCIDPVTNQFPRVNKGLIISASDSMIYPAGGFPEDLGQAWFIQTADSTAVHIQNNTLAKGHAPQLLFSDTALIEWGRMYIDSAANIGIGLESFSGLTTGSQNTFLGASSGAGTTSGSRNSGLGSGALGSNTSKGSNTAVGYKANGGANTAGVVAIGSNAGYTSASDSTLWVDNTDKDRFNTLIWGDFANDSLRLNGTVKIKGDMTYDFVHGVASADSITPAYAPTVTQNIYTKINTGAFTSHEADGVTIAGDSIKILKSGDYRVDFSITIAGTNNAQWRIKLFKNNAAPVSSLGRFVMTTTSASRYDTYGYFWYVTLAANDYISFRITNLTNNDDPNITDYKVLITKIPE